MPEPEMTPAMYGPDITFAGVPRTGHAACLACSAFPSRMTVRAPATHFRGIAIRRVP
jgi:hypothetical protein